MVLYLKDTLLAHQASQQTDYAQWTCPKGKALLVGSTPAGTPKYVALGPRSDRQRPQIHFIISSSSMGLGTQEGPSLYEKILHQVL